MTFYIKQNDTSPSIVAELKDGSDVAIDLTDATVRFHMRKIGSDSVVTDQPALIVTPLTGLVRYNWSSSDTENIGSYQAEFEVTFVNYSVETFPNNRFIEVEITDDIT